MKALAIEKDEQLIQLFLSQISTTYWQFHNADSRMLISKDLEDCLIKLIEDTHEIGLKKSYYNSLKSIALSGDVLNMLFKVWEKEQHFKGIELSENDRTELAYQLALKLEDKSDSILKTQLDRIRNADRKLKMEFIIPALSKNQQVRDAFFESLSLVENRAQEPWVGTALRFLHHPLRAEKSIKYIKPSLDLLYEIKITGDIFFPKSWLDATFWGHQSKEANAIVDQFLASNPNYHEDLKLKILQSTDFLKRNQ
jgi:aminopeptidase N